MDSCNNGVYVYGQVVSLKSLFLLLFLNQQIQIVYALIYNNEQRFTKKKYLRDMEDSGIDSDPKNPLTNENGFVLQENLSDSSSSSNCISEFPKDISSRHLHKKIKQRIQEAKRIQKSQDQKKPFSGPNLIPIQRLSIPSKPVILLNKEHFPLVDWDTEDSDEDIHFFPAKPTVKQELVDTFSIEEYQVSPDEDDLNLLPPKPVHQRVSFCCFSVNSKCSIL